ncbi:hypothetical protein [Salinigranum halophilum]|uniref:hypothetical protein n=1 Tax=Salinigranum halophilum TaxID=2565931 RepID=UPI0010A75A2E|nr:hypothetical protein [Salinigranum halophilum]
MPSFDRRRYLHTAGAGLLWLVAGCTGGSPTGSSSPPTRTPTRTSVPTTTVAGTYGDFVDGPRSYPDRPADPSREAVREYVRDAERARTYNALFEPDMTDSSVQCRTTDDRAAQGGHYVLASCSGYANYPEAHADWGQTSALYFVTADLTIRVADYDSRHIHCTEVFASSDPGENFAAVCEGGDASYRVYNVHPESHTVAVTVEFLGENGADETSTASQTVLERDYTLAPTAGVKEESVTYRKGVYRVRATLDGETKATYRWDLQFAPTAEDPPLVVLVTPAGGLTIRWVPLQTV